ncbi:MAG: DUF1236 domain-containing protein [Stellaceae bacterium]
MKNYPAHRLTAIALVCAAIVLLWTGVDVASAQAGGIHEVANPNGVEPKLELTAAQRSAIYQAVSQDKGKVAPSRFPTTVGGEVPPMIELYLLPDDIVANNPVTKLYKFTRVEDRVVLVDPTNMRVVAVIGP